MPMTRISSDMFGAITICLVVLLIILGWFCIIYLLYFQYQVQSHDSTQLGYFNGPWMIRMVLIFIAILWGSGEILRLSLFKGKGRVFHSLNLKSQENICKFYILLNLGLAEPSFFLTFLLLLHSSLQRREQGALSRKWNQKTICYVLVFVFPVFIAQMVLELVGPNFNGVWIYAPKYFTSSSTITDIHNNNIAICTYPLMSDLLHGLFAAIFMGHCLFLTTKMISVVINRRLQRRIFLLIFTVSIFLPLRILFLGFSVLTQPGKIVFELLVFLAFLALLLCLAIVVVLLVYYPISDSLAFRGDDTENSLVDINRHIETASTTSAGRNSEETSKRGSISFRTMINSLPGSPAFLGQPMVPLPEA